MRIKSQYVQDNNYRGMIVWDTTLDDCNDTLAKALNEGIGRVVNNPPTPGCRP